MLIDRIALLLERSGTANKNFPPTDLYNEGWMLRVVLDWLSQNPNLDHDLSFTPSDNWYSEALLTSAFLARHRGDGLAESWTHADGAIGDFVIGANRDGDLSLKEGASRIIITEAKMFSKLSSGVKNASYYNQAARNVACIAEVLCRAEIPPRAFDKIAFFVVAPLSQINDGVFADYVTKESIRNVVHQRVSEYESSEKETWFRDWFMPTLESLQVREVSWEKIVGLIENSDSSYGGHIDKFYQQCLEFNRFVANRFS